MYIIGLTGGIASGKSAVSGILSSLGAYIIDTDIIAREIVKPGETAWQEIVACFGKGILLPDDNIDRNLLGKIVFENIEARTQLEKITHRRIKEKVVAAIKTARKQKCDIAVLDVPLLLEAGWQELADAVWVVYVTKPTQLTRLIKRNGLSPKQGKIRIKAQMDLEEKLLHADVVIDNNGDLDNTRQQVLAAWQRVKTGASG